MSSLTDTGMNLRPLWTLKLSPTNCGRMVERRDQVLIGVRALVSCAVSAFFRRWRSTNGPFQTERAMSRLPLLLGVTRTDDHLVRLLVAAGAGALGRLAPRGDRVTAARGAAFAAAVRVIDRVLGDAAGQRTTPLPAGAAGLAEVLVLVVRVRDRAHRPHGIAAD